MKKRGRRQGKAAAERTGVNSEKAEGEKRRNAAVDWVGFCCAVLISDLSVVRHGEGVGSSGSSSGDGSGRRSVPLEVRLEYYIGGFDSHFTAASEKHEVGFEARGFQVWNVCIRTPMNERSRKEEGRKQGTRRGRMRAREKDSK